MTDAAGDWAARHLATRALAAWHLPGARLISVLHRENTVWRVRADRGDFALRLHRPGLRQPAHIAAELAFMAHLAAEGLSVPAPQPTRNGDYWVELDGLLVNLLSWVPGRTLPPDTALPERVAAYDALGREMARLHAVSDGWLPADLCRPVWDVNGLTGPAPVWGRWQDHPGLTMQDHALMQQAQELARDHLLARPQDFGPIHADLVIENVLYDGNRPWLIDFDDFGTGYRLFDLATVLLRAEREPDYDLARAALLRAYQGARPLDMEALPQMMALRSLTYLGWIIPRIAEPGGAERSARFLGRARRHCTALLGG